MASSLGFIRTITGPAQVHIFNAGKEVKINLGITGRPEVCRNFSMQDRDVKKGLVIVAENNGFLLKKWRQIHGEN